MFKTTPQKSLDTVVPIVKKTLPNQRVSSKNSFVTEMFLVKPPTHLSLKCKLLNPPLFPFLIFGTWGTFSQIRYQYQAPGILRSESSQSLMIVWVHPPTLGTKWINSDSSFLWFGANSLTFTNSTVTGWGVYPDDCLVFFLFQKKTKEKTESQSVADLFHKYISHW